ncbi:MAG: site-2 protease family protein [Oculatellaceae cyanobacterium Prado106]|jgi:Zn-dependent protease|nr:site-2 protease family protein [Oculatellaceae cyanobacterium Prado106]
MFLSALFANPVFFLRVVFIIIFSITIHELAHGVAAMSQGDDTPQKSGHITFNPVVHMGWHAIVFLCVAGIAWGQMPVNPENFRRSRWGQIVVAIAGPAANLGLAILALLLMQAQIHQGSPVSLEFLFLVARINFVLFLLNLIPIPPLDGFQVFSEAFPGLKPAQDSPFALFALMLLFLMPGFSEWLSTIADIVIQACVGIRLVALQ